jgi:surfeit locus 1 family protein
MPAEPLPLDLEELEKMEYQTVTIRGQFLHDKEIIMGPRSLIKPDDVTAQGGGVFTQQNSSGYLIITPFKLEGRDDVILVNRGWVSRKNLKPENRQQGQIKGIVELQGVVRNHEDRPSFTPKHKNREIFLYRDVHKMCDLTGAKPYFIDANFESTAADGPIGGQTKVNIRNEHLSYIITWYSLSALTAFLWYRQIIKRKPF